MRQERRSIPLIRMRTRNALIVGGVSRIYSSDALLMVMKSGDS
jgi:hypothetical protein